MSVSHSAPLGPLISFLIEVDMMRESTIRSRTHRGDKRRGCFMSICVLHFVCEFVPFISSDICYVFTFEFFVVVAFCPPLLPVLSLPDVLVLTGDVSPLMLHLLLHSNYYCVIMLFFLSSFWQLQRHDVHYKNIFYVSKVYLKAYAYRYKKCVYLSVCTIIVKYECLKI